MTAPPTLSQLSLSCAAMLGLAKCFVCGFSKEVAML
jgi:hypothetical protein